MNNTILLYSFINSLLMATKVRSSFTENQKTCSTVTKILVLKEDVSAVTCQKQTAEKISSGE